MQYLGETAALFTSFCWSLSAVGFSMAGKKFDSTTINRVRVSLAFIALLVFNQVLYGQAFPINASSDRFFWLMLSGVIGLALGDFFLFRSYQLVGPRIGLLLLSLAPVYSAIIAWLFLGEQLATREVIGIIVTLGGIAWVVMSGSKSKIDEPTQKHSSTGILYGCIAALGQSIGMVLSRQGMYGQFPPFAGSLIRITAAVLFLWVVAIFQRTANKTIQSSISDLRSTGWVSFGALFGPVIGVSASLLAIQNSNLGVASTLMALPPVFMLPISYFFFKERFGWQSVAGTILAIAGVGILLT